MSSGFWTDRPVLLTGAGGFVGSWLARALLQRGADVHVVLRDLPAVDPLRLLGIDGRVTVVRGSITDHPLMERVVNEREIDTCFHLAAQAIVGAANRSPLSTFESNIRGTWTVLEACRTGSTLRRIVVASSDKAYGTQPVLPYTEDMALLGRSPYEASKVCTDVLAQTYHATYGVPIAVARCANIYGPCDLNYSRLVPGTVRSALRDERPVIRSDGSPVRDYIHVDDAVRGYLLLAECMEDGVAGRAVNFGSGEPLSVLDLVRRILDACGRPQLQPDVRGRGSLAGEIDRQYLDSTVAKALLGWTPDVPLQDGLERTASWYAESCVGV